MTCRVFPAQPVNSCAEFREWRPSLWTEGTGGSQVDTCIDTNRLMQRVSEHPTVERLNQWQTLRNDNSENPGC
jgi:hypothetical protein